MKSSSRKMAQLIDSSEGKMVSVQFIKKDGTLRTLNGRLGVKKHLKGGKRTTDPAQYICIFENGNSYRSINRDTIVSLKMAGLDIVNTQLAVGE